MSDTGATSEDRRNFVDVEATRRRCQGYRQRILEVSQQVSALHIAPAFSCLEITDALYNLVMKSDVSSDNQDVFLMSKGHGCMIQYIILEDHGILETRDIELYCKPEGRLGAHPDYGNPGIHASTGSLGHGLGIATGQAYAEKLKGSDTNVFCVLSDGEFQEGSTWEAFLMAANLGLANLVAVVDNNDFSGLERMSEGHPAFYPLAAKAEAFCWEVVEVDGHNSSEIAEAIWNRSGTKPFLVVAKTVKGKGVSFMEHVPIWHYRSPNEDEYKQALLEVSGGGK